MSERFELVDASGQVYGYCQPSQSRRGRWYVKVTTFGAADSYYVGRLSAWAMRRASVRNRRVVAFA